MTAEFCKDTIEGLSSAIHKDIKPSLSDQVSNTPYKDIDRRELPQQRTGLFLTTCCLLSTAPVLPQKLPCPPSTSLP